MERIQIAATPDRAASCAPGKGLSSWSLACAAWAALAIPSLILSVAAPGGILGDQTLPRWASFTLACTELVALAFAVALCAGLLAATRRLEGRPWLMRGVRWSLVAAFLTCYAGSWATFWITGRFLGVEGLEMLVTNSAAMIRFAQVMYAPLFLMPILALALAAGVTELLPRWVGRWPSATVRGFNAAAGSLLLACLLAMLSGQAALGWAGERVTDRATGTEHDLPDFYRYCRDHRSGPLTHGMSNLIDRPGGPPAEIPEPPPPRPMVTMPEYLAGIDPAKARRSNVVVVVIDSLRADQIRAGGSTRTVMPAVEALAAESRVYTDCVSTATHTDYAAPTPLSSQYPLRGPSIHRYPRRPPYPRLFIYDILKARGYRVGLFSAQDDGWGRMIHHYDTGSVDRHFHGGEFDPRAYSGAERELARRQTPESAVDDSFAVTEALRWVDTLGKAPFFMAFNFQNAHAPYLIPANFPRPFGPSRIDFTVGYGTYPPSRTDVARDLYADSLAYVDSQLERLFRGLRERGLWSDTIVVITADHGEAFHEHGFAAHGSALYDEVLRVPLVVRVPGLAPAVDGRPAQILDAAPTLLHALGLPPHPAFQGLDLLARDPAADRARFAVVHTAAAHQYAVIRGPDKLIYDAHQRRYLLYDLAQDPAERTELSASRPERVEALAALLAAWYRSQIDFYKNPPPGQYPPFPKP